MDDLSELVNFDKIYSYQTNPYYKRIRFREESDMIHYREAEQIVDESAHGFLEKELTKIHLNQLFAETKKKLEKSIANARDPKDYVDEKIERIKQSREAGNQYSRYNALPSGKKEKQKPVMPEVKRVNPLMMKAKIYGKMVSNENRKKYEAKPKVYKPNMANVKRLMRLQKPRNRLNEYGHYYSIRNRLLYKEEIEEFDNEFTELLLECVLFEKDHLDVQGYLEEKLRLHQFEIPKCARKLGIGTETEIEIERISNKSSNNELSSDNYGFDSNLDVPIASKKIPVKHNIPIKHKPPQRNDSFVKNYYDLIEDDDRPDIIPYDTNNILKNNNKLIILKPDASSDEIILTDMKTNRNDENVIEDHNEETNEMNANKIINVKISNLSNINSTDNNIKMEERNIMSNIDNINNNIINELESNADRNNGTEKPRPWDISKAQSMEKNYRVNIADIINEFNLKLKARNINTINADNIPSNDNNNINATKNSTVININTINSNYVPEPAPSKADTSTTYYSTNSVAANPNNTNLLQQPKDLFERIIKFNSVGVHTDNIDTFKCKYLPAINEETENNEQSCLESISPTQSFMSLPPPPSEMELKLLEETFTARSQDHSDSKPMEIICDSKVNLVKDHVDKNFIKYMQVNKTANDDDIALENYSEENEPTGCVHRSLIEKFQNILKN